MKADKETLKIVVQIFVLGKVSQIHETKEFGHKQRESRYTSKGTYQKMSKSSKGLPLTY